MCVVPIRFGRCPVLLPRPKCGWMVEVCIFSVLLQGSSIFALCKAALGDQKAEVRGRRDVESPQVRSRLGNIVAYLNVGMRSGK